MSAALQDGRDPRRVTGREVQCTVHVPIAVVDQADVDPLAELASRRALEMVERSRWCTLERFETKSSSSTVAVAARASCVGAIDWTTVQDVQPRDRLLGTGHVLLTDAIRQLGGHGPAGSTARVAEHGGAEQDGTSNGEEVTAFHVLVHLLPTGSLVVPS